MDIVERTDVGFRALRKIQVFDGEVLNKDDERLSLVACSSKYGLVFAGAPSSLITLKADLIRQFDGAGEHTRQPEVADHGGMETSLPGQPVAVKISCDELTVAVVCSIQNSALMCLLFDVRSLAVQGDVDPFMRIPLHSSPAVRLLDFAFNPVTANCFVAVLSDCSAVMFTIKDESFELSTLPATGQKTASCVCWSPKGKQLVLGHSDGKLTQHKPDWTLAKTVAAPTGQNMQAITGSIGDNLKVLDVQWLATFVFLVAYGTVGSDPQIHLVLLHAPKAGNPVYSSYGDLCFGAAAVRPAMYLMEALRDWGLVACASSNAIEVGVVGKMQPSDADDQFKAIVLDDSSRAEIPLRPDGSEDFPVGLCSDFSSTENIMIGENGFPPAPILLLYSGTGLLCPFHFMYNKPGVASLQVARMDIKAAGVPKKGVARTQAKPPPALTPFATPSAQRLPQPPAFGAGASAFGKPPAYNATPGLGAAAPTTFGQPAAPALFPTKPAATIAPAPAAQPSSQPPDTNPVAAPVQPTTSESLSTGPSAAALALKEQQDRMIETAKCHQLIKEELANFEKELRKLRLDSAKDDFNVAPEEVKAELQADMRDLKISSEKSRKVASAILEKITELQAEAVDTFNMLRESEELAMRQKDSRFRGLLEIQSPSGSITRRIRDLKETRRYFQEQLDLARRTLAAELQKDAILARGPRLTGSNASFNTLMMSMRASRDPNAIQAFMRKEKEVLRNVAFDLDNLRARARRVDSNWGDEEDRAIPSALDSCKMATETPKALRKPFEQSPRRPPTFPDSFKNAREASDALCKGVPQLSKEKLEILWKAYTPRKVVRVRKVEGVKVEGFGLEPAVGEKGRGEATLPVGKSPAKPAVTPVVSPLMKPTAITPRSTPNAFAELKRSVQAEDGRKQQEETLKKKEERPKVTSAPPPTVGTTKATALNGVAAVQRSLPSGVTLTPVSSKPASIISSPNVVTAAPAATAFTPVATATTKATLLFGPQPVKPSSLFGGLTITPVAAKKEEKLATSVAPAQTTPLSLTTKPADAKAGFSFSLKPTSPASSISPPAAAASQPTVAFSGTGFVLGSRGKKDDKEEKEEGKSTPAVAPAPVAKPSFAGGSITAGTSIFGGKSAFGATSTSTAGASLFAGLDSSATSAKQATPTSGSAFDFNTVGGTSGSSSFSFGAPTPVTSEGGGGVLKPVATTTAAATSLVTTAPTVTATTTAAETTAATTPTYATMPEREPITTAVPTPATATSLPAATTAPSITSSLFDSQKAETTSAEATVATTTPAFATMPGSEPTTTSSMSLFGSGAFGPKTTTSAPSGPTPSLFGGFGSTTTESSTAAASPFGAVTTTTSGVSAFGAASTSAATPFGAAATPSSFGAISAALSSPFGATTATSVAKPFGTAVSSTTPAPAFSITPVKPSTPSIFGGGGSLTSGTSVFGGGATSAAKTSGVTTSTSSVFGGTPSVMSPFGQATAAAAAPFGGSPFGTPKTEAAAQPSSDASKNSFSFSLKALNAGTASPNVTITTPGPSSSFFGSSSGAFGSPTTAQTSNAGPSSAVDAFASSLGSGFGLGGTPSAANANKNVFGGGTPFGASSGTTSSIFGGASSASKPNVGFGSPSGSGNAFGIPTSVTTSTSTTSTAGGFGPFSSPSAGAFGSGSSTGFGQPAAFGSFSTSPGSASAFGGAPAFGSGSAFGSTPGFGSSGSVFGSSPAATSGSSMFGSLAARNDVPTFGSISGSTTESSFGFGGAAASQPNQGTAFGFGSSGGPAFGGGGFGQQQQQQQQQQPQQASFGGGQRKNLLCDERLISVCSKVSIRKSVGEGGVGMTGNKKNANPAPAPAVANNAKPPVTGPFLLHRAAETGDIEKVKKILEAQPDKVNLADSKGMTPLHWACRYDHLDVAKLLVEHGADYVKRAAAGYEPIHTAAKWGACRISGYLLTLPGVNVNSLTDEGYTPLHVTIQYMKQFNPSQGQPSQGPPSQGPVGQQ